jgi:peptide subunit release factor RF-3
MERKRRMDEQVVMINKQELASKGKQIYAALREKLEPEHKGRIVVIDPDTGDYFLGDTLLEADKKARRKYPGKVFYAVKIGYPAVYVHR